MDTVIFIFYLTLLLKVYGLYNCSKMVSTPFYSKDEFINCFSKSKFFFNYIDFVKGSDVIFTPELLESNLLQFPQSIKYRAVPDIPYVPCFMLSKINVHQKWNKHKLKFIGEIHTKFLTFDLTLTTIDKDGKIYMNMEGVLKDKLSILPNHTLDLLIEQFGEIFKKIVEVNI